MVHGAMKRRSQTNIANKLPIQFSYAENTATAFLRSANQSLPSSTCFRVLVPCKRKLTPVRRIARIDSLSHLSTLCNQICCRCSFDNDEVKCKYRRIESLRIHSPQRITQGSRIFFMTKREQEGERKREKTGVLSL